VRDGVCILTHSHNAYTIQFLVFDSVPCSSDVYSQRDPLQVLLRDMRILVSRV
jgi:hypothetical protein